MYTGQMVFSQVMNLVLWRRFQTCVDRYHGDTGVLCDQRVRLTGTNAPKDYPEMIRHVRYGITCGFPVRCLPFPLSL